MKKSEITPEFIEKIKPIVQKTAGKVLLFCDITFIEHKHFNIEGKDSNYLVFGLMNVSYGCLQNATYDCEYEAIDFSLHRVAVIK